MAKMEGETCNHCEGDITCEEDVIAVVCPHCGNITGVCANCAWYFTNLCGDPCPFNVAIKEEDRK